MKEQDIIELLQSKNEDGLTALITHYGPLMRYIIAPILPNPQDQEDCLAEVTMRVWDKIDQFNPKRGSWKAWLTAITRNTALNHVRSLARHSSSGEIPENHPSSEPTPEEKILLQEQQKNLEKALNRLSSRDRLLFYRKYYYLQSTAQIAAELGITERAVEGRLYRLRKTLQKLLGGDHDD
ncbi:MAG: sigma-70 family RNA polymerase sigma factor [Peptococcaceae bacterium]|nr:sigma-70 family RNA polymerase sigma factor [Peptococcaceae bacterium]